MKKTYLVGSFLLVGLFSVSLMFPNLSFADTICNPTYGYGQQCVTTQLTLNKMVKQPNSDSYIENMLPDVAPFYRPSETVVFKVTVQNTGNKSLSPVDVADTLPLYVDLDSVKLNMDGKETKVTVNKTNRQFGFTINNLNAGESKDAFISANIYSTAALPSGNTNCAANFAQASASDTGTASDTAQYCVRKEVLGITAVPKTGASEVVLLSLGGLASVGYILRKTVKFKI